MVLNSTTVQLSWQHPESPNDIISGYLVILDNRTDVINITVNTTSNQTVIVSGLMPFTLYGYRVRTFWLNDARIVHLGIATNEVLVRTKEDGKVLCYSYKQSLHIDFNILCSTWSSYKL